jgi:ribosomal protein L11 methyltransferase
MIFLECIFKLDPFEPYNEILIARLGDLDFDSFQEDEPYLKAFIEKNKFPQKEVLKLISEFPQVSYEGAEELEQINWNEEWEKNFNPLAVGDFCFIRAPFHAQADGYEYELIIEPKMSFGTGHHATTRCMIKLMRDVAWKRTDVLDLGSGTGILAILAKKMGANEVLATDIEDWAYDNMRENFERNACTDITSLKGSLPLEALSEKQFDLVLANINKNVLMEQVPLYAELLNDDGILMLSGFYSADLEDIVNKCSAVSLKMIEQTSEEDWMAVAFHKG